MEIIIILKVKKIVKKRAMLKRPVILKIKIVQKFFKYWSKQYVLLRQDPCILPVDGGSCDNYKIFWYYNTAIKECDRFYYGGRFF